METTTLYIMGYIRVILGFPELFKKSHICKWQWQPGRENERNELGWAADHISGSS